MQWHIELPRRLTVYGRAWRADSSRSRVSDRRLACAASPPPSNTATLPASEVRSTSADTILVSMLSRPGLSSSSQTPSGPQRQRWIAIELSAQIARQETVYCETTYAVRFQRGLAITVAMP